MSEAFGPLSGIESSSSSSILYEVLKSCANLQSYDSLPIADYNDVCPIAHFGNVQLYGGNYKMPSTNLTSRSSSSSSASHASGTISYSFASDDSFGDNILEEDGRISLAYENLGTIPRRIAEKFAMQTKFLDLSYNNFQNLNFLTFFEELHTLILDRNYHLDVNSLPYLPSLKILWINNCDITNVTDWLHRIKTNLPDLEMLSLMGNPGIKNLPYCYNFAKDSIGDYRDYILELLPDLQYLDGLPRSANDQKTSGTPAKGGKQSNGKISDGSLGMSNSSARLHESQKSSPTLSLKNLFRRRRRKSLQTTSSG